MTTLDDILAEMTSPLPDALMPVQTQDGGGEMAVSYARRLVRAGLLEGTRWMATQLHSQSVYVQVPQEEEPHVHPGVQEPEPDVRLRSDDQSRKMFATLGEAGFDTQHDRDGILAFVNAVLGKGQWVESTRHLTVDQASRVIGVLVTLPAVIAAEERRRQQREEAREAQPAQQ